MNSPVKNPMPDPGHAVHADNPAPHAKVSLLDPKGRRLPRLPAPLKPLGAYLRRLTAGRMRFDLPNGHRLEILGTRPGPTASMQLSRWRVFPRAILRGDVGLGEAFMDRDWDSDDVAGVLYYFALNTVENGLQFTPKGPAGWALTLAHALRANSLRRAPKNIAAHYDLGNAFYAAWLDPLMMYSSALFDGDTSDLATAQVRKADALIASVGIGPGDHVLEIGCGWGGFASHAARKTGCKVTAITLSPAQRDHALALVSAQGLTGQVTVLEQDYRAVTGAFDHIISIEMIEAVGERYWPVYFNTVAALLKPGGAFGLQAITIRDDAFPEYRKTSDFLQTYIFPGGMLLPEQGMQTIARQAGLSPSTQIAFGPDYAATLAHWQRRFDAAWPKIATMGFDDRFNRMWRFYLSACQAGFQSGLIDVSQTVYHHTGPTA